MAKPSAALAAAIRARPESKNPDKLQTARDLIAKARDLRLTIESRDEANKSDKTELKGIEQKSLPELFQELKIRNLGLEAVGNTPAYEARLKPYYHANIQAEWPDEDREKGFKYLEDTGNGDMIKTVITIELPRGERTTAIKVEKALDKLKVPYTSEKAVPWGTLTAWLKEMIEVHKETPPLETIGATVTNVVSLTKIKEKK